MLKPSFGDLLKSSIKSILKNKSRTILTSLGIIIGVTSVILLTSIGNGLQIYINQQFESMGSNMVFIMPGKLFNDKGGFNGGASARFVTTTFTERDLKNLKRELKNTEIMQINIMASTEIKHNKVIKKDMSVVGTTENYGKLLNSLPKGDNGSWFTKEDYDKSANVAVLGYKIAQDLFPDFSPINKTININARNFKVIGVIDKKGSSFGGPDEDNYVYAPFKTVANMIGKNNIQEIVIKVNDKTQIENVKNQAKTIMLKKYKEDSFSVFDSSQLLSSINSIIGILTVALSGIAAISLVVGGIGIMNIMLVSVTERTKEIGLRKAIGAYPQAILIQFLIESVILSALGGGIGILLGALGTWAINTAFPARITLSSVLLAFGVSSLVGIIFGVVPARKASKLSPIEALRYE
jgi:putative ABC transport system permease protein